MPAKSRSYLPHIQVIQRNPELHHKKKCTHYFSLRGGNSTRSTFEEKHILLLIKKFKKYFKKKSVGLFALKSDTISQQSVKIIQKIVTDIKIFWIDEENFNFNTIKKISTKNNLERTWTLCRSSDVVIMQLFIEEIIRGTNKFSVKPRGLIQGYYFSYTTGGSIVMEPQPTKVIVE